MKKIFTILSFLLFFQFFSSASEDVFIDFNNYASIVYNSSGCFFILDDVKMKFYDGPEASPQFQICHTLQPNEIVVATKINRCDLPLSTSPGLLSINANSDCSDVIITVEFTDGTSDFFGNSIIIDESEKSIKEIIITEIECSLLKLDGGLPVYSPVTISFHKESYTLLSPENETKNQPLETVFEWTGDDQAMYILQIDTLQTFNAPVFQFNVTGNQKLVTTLKNNTTYYWRVKEKNAYCPNAWSEVWMFSTICKLDVYRNVLETDSKFLYQTITSDIQQEFEYDMLADASLSMTVQFNRGYVQIRDGASKEVSGEIISSIENGMINLAYNAPHIFEPGKVIYLDFKHRLDLTEPDLIIKLNIKPPPVILLHGEFSSAAQSWDALTTSLVGGGWDPNYIIKPNYNNSASFTASSGLVEGFINQALYTIRILEDDFGNKVSLVGHSMGGLVIKNYLSNNSDNKNISRVITMNTPHFGTPMADLMTENGIMNWVGRQSLAFAGVTNNNNGLADINNGALTSLRTDNPDLLSIDGAGSNIPAHAMASQTDWACTSDYLETLAEVTILAPVAILSVGFELCENLYSYIAENELPLNQLFCTLNYILLEDSNDGFVGVNSQLGNLSGSATTNQLGFDYNFTHYKNPKQFLTVTKTKELLETDSEGAAFSKNGFRPNNSDPIGINPTENDLILSDTIVEINIENIHNNDTICASIHSKINITGNDSTNRLMIIYFFGNDTIILDSIRYGTYDFTIPYPEDYEGDMFLGVAGSDGNGHFDFKVLNLYVEGCQSSTNSLISEPDFLVFPNPVRESAKIEIKNEEKYEKIVVFDMTGQVVSEQILQPLNNTIACEISFGNFPSGIYYLAFYSNSKMHKTKIVKI
ncbi:MAG: T9SS type A sorting domain-containing protein [Saprospiraceae bacterium]|nr:T9SS type A sorting domain-containing protein [Saprospiraceae bacterium]